MNVHVCISAPAKLNFFLHITGKRPDGYHLIESLAVFTEFGDVLDIIPSDAIALTLTGPFASLLAQDSGDNLVMRAARMLQQRTGYRAGAHITLHKHIPVGAGLGGGSADAAASLHGLEKLWGLTLDTAIRQDIAMQLGSDVPVCLMRKPAWIRGIGEQVTEVPMPADMWTDIWVVLVNPRMPLLTADVYWRFAGHFSPPSPLPATVDSLASLVQCIQERHNVLETPAMALLPVIGDILTAIRATSGCILARMSGSGATCFGLYDGEAQAQQALQDLQYAHPAWWLQTTSLLRKA